MNEIKDAIEGKTNKQTKTKGIHTRKNERSQARLTERKNERHTE